FAVHPMNRADIPLSSRLHPQMTGTVPVRPQSAKPMLHTEVTEIAGQRIMVTGGTPGIRRAGGALLSSYGPPLHTLRRTQKPLDEALAYIRSAGGEAEGTTGALTDPDDVRRIFAKADDAFGGLDVLVNNAALPADGIMQMEEAEWRYAVEANLVGQLAC